MIQQVPFSLTILFSTLVCGNLMTSDVIVFRGIIRVYSTGRRSSITSHISPLTEVFFPGSTAVQFTVSHCFQLQLLSRASTPWARLPWACTIRRALSVSTSSPVDDISKHSPASMKQRRNPCSETGPRLLAWSSLGKSSLGQVSLQMHLQDPCTSTSAHHCSWRPCRECNVRWYTRYCR